MSLGHRHVRAALLRLPILLRSQLVRRLIWNHQHNEARVGYKWNKTNKQQSLIGRSVQGTALETEKRKRGGKRIHRYTVTVKEDTKNETDGRLVIRWLA